MSANEQLVPLEGVIDYETTGLDPEAGNLTIEKMRKLMDDMGMITHKDEEQKILIVGTPHPNHRFDFMETMKLRMEERDNYLLDTRFYGIDWGMKVVQPQTAFIIRDCLAGPVLLTDKQLIEKYYPYRSKKKRLVKKWLKKNRWRAWYG